MTQKLIIEFPDTAEIPDGVAEDQDSLRYAIVAALYRRGALTKRAARELTGDSRRYFEEKMAEHDCSLMGDEPEDVTIELNA